MTDEVIQPFRLVPKQQPTVWGGHLLQSRLRKPGSREPIGESWEVWEGDPVAAGPFAGMLLEDLVTAHLKEVLGATPLRRSARFPLLTKFIDAQEPLSVQVHPTDRWAQDLEGQPNGKTEAWHIVEASPDAWIIHGLTREVDPVTFRRLLEAGTADDLLRKIKAVPGETIFVPAGTVHAIGPGVLLHEVQQTSDITYRLYDWNRQARGSKRELHLDKGLQVSQLAPSAGGAVLPLVWTEGDSQLGMILATEYFTVKRVELCGALDLSPAGSTFHIITVLNGNCRLDTTGVQDSVSVGESMVVPAYQDRYRLVSEATATVLVEYVADVEAEVLPELKAQGFEESQIHGFLAQFKG